MPVDYRGTFGFLALQERAKQQQMEAERAAQQDNYDRQSAQQSIQNQMTLFRELEKTRQSEFDRSMKIAEMFGKGAGLMGEQAPQFESGRLSEMSAAANKMGQAEQEKKLREEQLKQWIANANIQGRMEQAQLSGLLRNQGSLATRSLANQGAMNVAAYNRQTPYGDELNAQLDARAMKGRPMTNINGLAEMMTVGAKTEMDKKAINSHLLRQQLEDIQNDPDLDRALNGVEQSKATLGNFWEKWRSIGGDPPKELQDAIAAVDGVLSEIEQTFNTYRGDVTGAAAAEQELKRLRDSYINGDLGPTRFKARLEKIIRKVAREAELYRQAGGLPPWQEPNRDEEERQRLIKKLEAQDNGG